MTEPLDNDYKCLKERELGMLIESCNNFKIFMDDIRLNHLKSIYQKLEIIVQKMNNRRPTYAIMWIITFLTTTCAVLLTILLKGIK